MFITHRPTLTLQLHNFDLFRTCRTSRFCTVARQLARFQLTRRIVRSLGDSGASFLLCQKVKRNFAHIFLHTGTPSATGLIDPEAHCGWICTKFGTAIGVADVISSNKVFLVFGDRLKGVDSVGSKIALSH